MFNKTATKNYVFIATVIIFGMVTLYTTNVHWFILYTGLIAPTVTASTRQNNGTKLFLILLTFTVFAGIAYYFKFYELFILSAVTHLATAFKIQSIH